MANQVQGIDQSSNGASSSCRANLDNMGAPERRGQLWQTT